RHFFNKTLEKKLAQLKGTSEFLTFFILDIDHFKLYNDHFGHQKGDEALILVANAIQNYIKSRDEVVFRLGGEEFGGLITNQNPKEMADWIAKLNSEVAKLKIVHADNAPETFLTVSIGVYSSHVKDMDSIRCLYRKADEALYLAKQEGRNKTVVIPSGILGQCA
ncbi:MAG: GGDEF domain-containing protein, partial [Pseudomonadota bacterium]|nr:GGDEF domain-containing protein [Pseudomonadota bacterium]